MSFIEKNETAIPSLSEKVGLVAGLGGIGLTIYTNPVLPDQINYIGIAFVAMMAIFVVLSVFQLRNTPEKERVKRFAMMFVMDLCMISILLISVRVFF